MKNRSFLLVLGMLSLLALAAYTGYLFWQKSTLDKDFIKAGDRLTTLQKEVSQYENQQVLEAVAAKRLVNDLGDNFIVWSEVVDSIAKTIPERSGQAIVDVLSYSGSTGNKLSLSVRTVGGSDEPYLDVADLIENFDKSPLFTDNFVPSISSGKNDRGEEVLTFVLSTEYVAASDESVANATSATGTATEESNPVKR